MSCEKTEIVSLTSILMKNVIKFAFRIRSGFPLKLMSCIVFESAPNACCLFKSTAIII